MPSVSVMIKPVSGLCNMNCNYCFYKDETSKREQASYGIMTNEVLDIVIRKTLAFADRECTIAFQGGEPTLVGLDYFERMIGFVKQYNIKNIKVNYAIQTNGYNMNEDWARFFHTHNFLVGLSLDGSKKYHDGYRLDNQKIGTFGKVMNAVKLLNQYEVEYNILTVVTNQTARHIGKIYGFFKDNKFLYQQYIPCIDPIEEKWGRNEYSLKIKSYEKFLKTLFDLWYLDIMKGKMIHIQYFENLILMLWGEYPQSCGMRGVCGRQWIIEADASVYPCDFYVLDAWKLGNLKSEEFNTLDQRRDELQFVEASKKLHTDCGACKYYYICRGGCKRYREISLGDVGDKNNYCEAYYNFFEYSLPRLQEIATMLKYCQIQ